MDQIDKRSEVRTPVTLIVDYDGADDFLGDYTENLSRGGTFVRTERELAPGTEVELVLSFPGLVRPIHLDGVVRWTRGAESGEEEHGVGLEFTGLDGDRRSELERVIAAIARRDPDHVGELVRVLVVEDNPHMARLIRDGLAASAGEFGDRVAFDFSTTGDGRAALDLCRTRRFDAAIIDIYLPGLDGASLIRELRSDPCLRDLPVIAVSAGGPMAERTALDAGADLFLGKPMRLRQVVDSMRTLFETRDGRPRTDAG